MKLFTMRNIMAAKFYSLKGGQALHVHTMHRTPSAPNCFKKSKEAAHLLDQDVNRLKKTVRKLGVRKLVVHHPGTPRQHIDICGKPLERAKAMAT